MNSFCFDINISIIILFFTFQDVMVVGEPSLMGGEFGDEDERLITRLENTQYDGTNSLDHDNHGFVESPLSNANSWVDRGGGSGAMNQNNQAPQEPQDKKSPLVPQ
jgi:LIM domain-binding protein 1